MRLFMFCHSFPWMGPALAVTLVNLSISALVAQSSEVFTKPALITVLPPALDGLEEAVANQIQDVQIQLGDHALASTTPPDEVMESFGLMGRIYHAYEFFESAESCYINASRLAPQDYRWPHLLGDLSEKQGDLEKAVLSFRKALELNRENVSSQVRLGRVLLGLNQLGEARAVLEAALKSGSDVAAAAQSLGELALAEERYENALSYLQQALKSQPAANRLHYLIGMAYRGLGRLDLAEKALGQSGIVGIRPSDTLVDELPELLAGERVFLIRGRVAFGAGRFQEAVDAFKQALDAAPRSLRAMINLASAYERNNEPQEAKKWFRRALAIEPDNFNAHFNLGVVLKQERRFDESIMHLSRAHDIQPNDVQNIWEWAQALYENGMHDEAIVRLFGLAAKAPGEENVVLQLAVYLVESERHAEAKYVLTQAHLLFPDRGLTAMALARFLVTCPDDDLRDAVVAIPLAARVYHAQPSIAHAETLVLALVEAGRKQDAVNFLSQRLAQADEVDNNLKPLQALLSSLKD